MGVRLWVVIVLVLYGAGLLGRPDTASAATENVFIVVIDGIRNQEAFDDPLHLYIPNMWYRMRPKGTILRNFKNPHFTWASPAESSIWTGCWDRLTWANENNHILPEQPTIFEYFRRELGISKDKAVLITGKPWILKAGRSLDPDYFTADYGPTMFGFATPVGDTDDLVYNEAVNQINTTQPRLCFIHLADVDLQGHTGIWSNYVGAIINADSIVYRLWNKLQASAYYQNKTALIVLSDKGRHDNRHGGFTDHGDLCDGCTTCMLLALGPSVPAGVQDRSYHELVDVAPTVGRLLGFSTPKAEGFAIASLLNGVGPLPNKTGVNLKGLALGWTSEVNLSDTMAGHSPGRSIRPDIACWQTGGQLHVVWCDDTSGSWQLMYALSTDGGQTWGSPIQISSGLDYRVTTPALAVDNSTTGAPGKLHVVWGGFRDGSWQLFYRSKDSTNSPATGWGAEELLSTPITPDNFFWSQFLDPDVAVDGTGKVHVVAVERDTDPANPIRGVPFGNRMALYYHVNDGGSWSPKLLISSVGIGAGRPRLACDALGYVNVTWECFTADIVNGYVTANVMEAVAYNTSAAAWAGQTWLTVPNSDVLALTPRITAYGQDLQTLWADGRTGISQLFGRTIVAGAVQAEIQFTNRTRGVWDPDLAVDSQGVLVAVGEDYANPFGRGEIYYLRDDGVSLAYQRLTANTGLTTHPAVALDSADRAHVVYQDNRSGNWEIYYKRQQ